MTISELLNKEVIEESHSLDIFEFVNEYVLYNIFHNKTYVTGQVEEINSLSVQKVYSGAIRGE